MHKKRFRLIKSSIESRIEFFDSTSLNSWGWMILGSIWTVYNGDRLLINLTPFLCWIYMYGSNIIDSKYTKKKPDYITRLSLEPLSWSPIHPSVWQDIFTLSYVTGRSVGIGAYLNRLGQRVIQSVDGPLVLTGYGALNKLLGKNVSRILEKYSYVLRYSPENYHGGSQKGTILKRKWIIFQPSIFTKCVSFLGTNWFRDLFWISFSVHQPIRICIPRRTSLQRGTRVPGIQCLILWLLFTHTC